MKRALLALAPSLLLAASVFGAGSPGVALPGVTIAEVDLPGDVLRRIDELGVGIPLPARYRLVPAPYLGRAFRSFHRSWPGVERPTLVKGLSSATEVYLFPRRVRPGDSLRVVLTGMDSAPPPCSLRILNLAHHPLPMAVVVRRTPMQALTTGRVPAGWPDDRLVAEIVTGNDTLYARLTRAR